MNAGEREGLREVLAAHREDPAYPDTCLCETQAAPDRAGHYVDHLETAVLDWLRARLASDEVREAVEALMPTPHGIHARVATAEVLTAVLATLGQAESGHEASATEPRSAEQTAEVPDGHRDDEGRPGARDGGDR